MKNEKDIFKISYKKILIEYLIMNMIAGIFTYYFLIEYWKLVLFLILLLWIMSIFPYRKNYIKFHSEKIELSSKIETISIPYEKIRSISYDWGRNEQYLVIDGYNDVNTDERAIFSHRVIITYYSKKDVGLIVEGLTKKNPKIEKKI